MTNLYTHLIGNERKFNEDEIKKKSSFLSNEYRNAILKILKERSMDDDEKFKKIESYFVDFIAGMTDAYAEDFLNKIINSEIKLAS